MKHCFDTVSYKGGNVICTGWAAPEQAGEHVNVAVFGLDGGQIEDVTVQQIKRSDVGQAVYGDDSFAMYGISIAFRPNDVQKYIIRLRSAESPEDVLEVPVDYPVMYEAYCKEHSFKERFHRFLEAKDKRDFFIEEKFMDLDDEEKRYAIWFEKQKPSAKELKAQAKASFAMQPKISIIVPLYNTPLNFLNDMVASVRNQSYGNWELCLANGSGQNQELHREVEKLMKKDSRIKYARLKENRGISGNTNVALKMAEGDYIALLDHDDFLMPNALYEYVKVLNEYPDADCIYSDEDKVDQEGTLHYFPHFKSDFNLDMLLTNNYICHFFLVRTNVIRGVGGFRKDFDGAQDFDLVLRCVEKSRRIVHVPKILYSWRCHKESTASNVDSKGYAFEAGKKAIEDYYERNEIAAKVETTKIPGYYKTKFRSVHQSLVSIIIPNKDHLEDLKRCITSLTEKSDYSNIEILIAENNSETEEIFAYYKEIQQKDKRIRVLTWEKEFNYAAINNFAAASAKGRYLLFLNNDTEVIDEDFLFSMMGYARRADVGVVGAKLLYPSNTIQHAGVIVGVEGVAFHQFLDYPENNPGYMGRAVISQDLSAVTGACMLVKKQLFEEVGGMDENLAVSYNDIDLCLKAREKGFLVVYDAFASLYHYESQSRGYEDSLEKKQRLQREYDYMKNKWKSCMGSDPYYNKNLSLKNGYYQLP